jgi:predicted ArsR family transcriptional regulator
MNAQPGSADADLDAVGALADPVRRRCYRLVVDAPAPIGKDEVAAEAGIGRSLATYHLDRLVDDGLLSVSFERRSGRQGPGAGRPAKLYRATEAEVSVQLPPRDDTLLARLLAAAIEADESGTTHDALMRVARTEGERAAPELGRGDRKAVMSTLDSRGYSPCLRDGEIRLRNCPFHHLVEQHRELVCGLNLELLSAAVNGARAPYEAELDPQPGACCVVLRPASN